MIADILHEAVDLDTGHIGVIQPELALVHKGRAFGYDALIDLTLNVPAYRGFVTGSEAVHLKEIGLTSEKEDVTVTIAEDAVFTGGTAIVPVATNRKYGGIKRFKFTQATATFDAAVSLNPQPADGAEPTVDYVRCGANLIHPAVAMAITVDPVYASDAEDYRGYGVEVKNVAQVDKSKAMSVTYKAKTVVLRQYTEQKTTWAVDTAYKFAQQAYDIDDGEGEPTIVSVYNGTRQLTLTTEYTIDQITDVGADQYKWTITIVDGETIDAEKSIFFVYQVEKSETPDYTEVLEDAGWEFELQRFAVATVTGTFEVGEKIVGEDSGAEGILERYVSGVGAHFIVRTISGTFVDDEEVEGEDSGATADVDSASEIINWYPFTTQSYDDSAITVATVYNDTEALSATVDYELALATTWKLTLKETAKTSETVPLIIVYQCQTMFSQGDGLIVYTGPTVTGAGTVISTYYLPGAEGVGQASAGDSRGDNWEIVLRPNTKYLVKALSGVSQKLQLRYRWYLEE